MVRDQPLRAGTFSICSITRNIGFVKERSDALPFLFYFLNRFPQLSVYSDSSFSVTKSWLL